MSSKQLFFAFISDIFAFATVVAIFTFLLTVVFSITGLKALIIVLAYLRVVKAIETW
jgi:hypothetical protein